MVKEHMEIRQFASCKRFWRA